MSLTGLLATLILSAFTYFIGYLKGHDDGARGK